MAFLESGEKSECFGCEACAQICARHAIAMVEDEEGFRYPHIDPQKCISCGLCRAVCPWKNQPARRPVGKKAFGGYHTNSSIRKASTSGGAFSAIVQAWSNNDGVIFGAVADGLDVSHQSASGKDFQKFRKSKYVQSRMCSSYENAKRLLRDGQKVLFSGTPCQIAGLRAYLQGIDQSRLLTVEVVCEGVPSPLFIRKYDQHMRERFGSAIKELDYRDKDGQRWDFEVMSTLLRDGYRLKKDRWFNPFWSIWLAHLMSRPSCYKCPYATRERVADITLGDLWGVHLYCPELYGHNGGASLIIYSTEKGKRVIAESSRFLYGHELDMDTAVKYQRPMRESIAMNPNREKFMDDLQKLPYEKLCQKWATRPTLKLLWSKYVWGNRQKIFFWNLMKTIGLNR